MAQPPASVSVPSEAAGSSLALASRTAATIAAPVAAVLVLLVPAMWNRFPLLQYDTGGYIARWYEPYLVPSRSTTFGLFLHLGERLDYWPIVIVQAVLTVWTVALLLRVLGLGGGTRRAAVMVVVLAGLTSLPWLTSLLLTDIFAGLGLLALWMLVARREALRRWETALLFGLVAFAAASHTATFAMLLAVLGAGVLPALVRRPVVPLRGLVRGLAAVAVGALLLLSTNLALGRQFAWTPGGFTIPFGRMLQDGIVARYLDDHCAKVAYRLCPHRRDLPQTADDFLWGDSVFNELGRFAGLGDEMRAIVIGSLFAYPWRQIETAAAAMATQLTMNASGEGVHDKLWHTYGIVDRFVPGMAPRMRAARQQKGEMSFEAVNLLHPAVATLSLVGLVGVVAWSVRRRRRDDVAVLAGAIGVAVLANAFVCGALSGPHDRYGARIAWLPTLVLAAAALRTYQAGVPRLQDRDALAPAEAG